MPLVLVRVDSRFIHGQVVETWVRHTRADCIIVANDDTAANPALRSVMELAVPPALRVVFCAVDDVAAILPGIDQRGEKAILLCASPPDALRIRRAGVAFPSLNIGNLHYAAGKVEISPSVFFAPEDFEAVDALESSGVSVDVRTTPEERGAPVARGRRG